MVACAAVFAHRVDDVGSFTWDGITTPRFITFWDQKVNAEWVTVPLRLILERWRAYICRFRRPDQLPTTPLFPGDGLAAPCLHDLVEGTPSAHITWHPWKWFSAAAYIWLGGTTVGLQQLAKWRSPRQARHYTCHPPMWTLPETLCLPLPPTPPCQIQRLTRQGPQLWHHRDQRLMAPRSLGPCHSPGTAQGTPTCARRQQPTLQ